MHRSLGLIALIAASTLLVTGCLEQVQVAEKRAEPFQETLEMQHSIEHNMQGEQGDALKVPGISAAVILPDGTTWSGVSGKSSDSEAMNSAMLFGLSSVTKTYIAALVAQLAEEGALSVEDPVGQWIPELGQIDGNITIRQLLSVTSVNMVHPVNA